MRVLLALVSIFAIAQPALADDLPPEVAAIEHDGQRGFFVPSALFVDMERAYERRKDLESANRALKAEVKHLRKSNRALVRSSSASADLASLYLRSYMSEREAHARTIAELARTEEQLVSLASKDHDSSLSIARDLVGLIADGAIIALIAFQASK